MRKRILTLFAFLAWAACFALLPASAFAAGIGTGAEITASNAAYFGRYPQTLAGTSPPGGVSGVDYIQAADNSSAGGGAQKYYSRDPIQWRVLQNSGGKLFLLSEKNLDARPYNNAFAKVTWETCTIRAWLNNESGFLGSAFRAEERGAIADTTVSNPDNPDFGTPGGNATTDRIFFLSIQEATNGTYFADAAARIAVNTAYAATRNVVMRAADYWWLRSPGIRANEGYVAAQVTWYGNIYSRGNPMSLNDVTSRPAFFLDLSSVLFTSDASGANGKSSVSVGNLAVATAPTGDVKLTIEDSSQTLTVGTSARQQDVPTLSFPYSNATTGAGQYISCVLTDNNDNDRLKYYGRLTASATSASANGNLSIPLAGVADGAYTLKIFSEKANGDNLTDFCSAPVAMTLTVSGGRGAVKIFGGTPDDGAPTESGGGCDAGAGIFAPAGTAVLLAGIIATRRTRKRKEKYFANVASSKRDGQLSYISADTASIEMRFKRGSEIK
ncbi:MAG: DUF6273 domain-containing protein [Gracilibacteraceae bacterium]|jgi:hypothetical protein|nr:DUF6273 domain-containing protein [Gracilibacteraceae bacterium]